MFLLFQKTSFLRLELWFYFLVFVVQLLSRVWLFAIPWTAACQVSLSFTIWVCSNSCPLTYHSLDMSKLTTIESVMPYISSSVAPSPLALNFPQHQGLFQWVSSLHQVPKYWSFSISLSTEYSELISLIDWLVGYPCSRRDSQESYPAPQFKTINSFVLSLLYGPTLKSIHDYWKNHSFYYMDLCRQSDVSAF